MIKKLRRPRSKIARTRNKKFSISTLFIIATLIFLGLLFYKSKVKKPANIFVLSGSSFSFKKGAAGQGPFLREQFSTGIAPLKISWIYNWGTLPFWGYYFEDKDWNNPEFIPHWLSRGDFCGCRTESAKTQLRDKVASRMNTLCSNNLCNKNRYHLIGNEPEIPGQDLCPGTTDAVQDAVNCYGIIAKTIKEKDPTAKLIMLGLGSDNTIFARSFIQKWKTTWQNTSIANLTTLINGWHFHDYGPYTRCPTDDARARNLLTAINQEIQTQFGTIIPNQEIWVTEMGSLTPPDPSNQAERQKFLKLMDCLVNVYENSSIVNRYAWFFTGDKNHEWQLTSLFNYISDNNIQMTDLGLRYSNLPLPPSPTPTPLPSVCTSFGAPIIDSQNLSFWKSSIINDNWGYGSPLIFKPNNLGKIDKVSLYAGGSGKIEVKVVNSLGVNQTNIVQKNVSSDGWLDFDFTIENVLSPAENYTILFRDPYRSNNVRLYHGNSFSYAYKVYIKPCIGGGPTGSSPTQGPILTPTSVFPSPTSSIPTPTPTQRPTSTPTQRPTNSPTPLPPTATPTSSTNTIPVITTSSLPAGTAGQSYSATLEGYDNNTSENLTAKYYGAPPGVSLGYCSQSISNNKKIIRCPLTGTISATAEKKTYYGYMQLQDSQGNTVKKDLYIIVK